jgi:outer membrane receptor protein involved in Fe transport
VDSHPAGLSRAARGATWVAGLVLSTTAWASAKLQTFHIDAGDATVTLNEFSRQSSLQLLFDYNVVNGRTTQAISGEYDAPTALTRMLTDTGLMFDFVNDRTLALTAASSDTGTSTATPGQRAEHRLRSIETQNVRHDGPGTADAGNGLAGAELQEVRITGTNVRGEQPIGSQVISLDRDEIEASGAATVQDFLRTLPQTFGGGPTEDTHFVGPEAQTNSGLGTGINLRGLGARATLVLINGRRLAPGGTEAEFVDVESIPLSAVERIDVLPDSASALYGADAVGGVVNFVMRDSFVGAETLARTGSGTDNTLGEYQLAQTLGKPWDSGNALISLEFYRRNALPSYARQYATSDLVPFGGDNFGSILSNPGNLSVGGQTYAIPTGQNGTHLTAADLVAGTQNLQQKYEDADLLPNEERWSLYASGKQVLNDRLDLFTDVLVSHRDAKEREGGLGASLVVPSTNPFYVNPTGGSDPVIVDYNFLDDLGPQIVDSLVNTSNITLGLDLNVGASWRVNVYGNYARETDSQHGGGLINYAALQSALADPDPSTAFNPFGAGSNTNPATLNAISSSSHFYVRSELRSGNVTADGPIVQLPGGAVKLALGADTRQQLYDTSDSASIISAESRISLSRHVTSAFGEVTIPLFGRDNGATGYRRLELSFASRYEDYSDFGPSTTPKVGLLWAPTEAFMVRGTWGRSTRVPTLADLDESQNVVIPYALPDSLSPTGVTNVLVLSGQNSRLTEERARSWTAGLDFNPARWLPGASLSLTYFDIVFSNRIEAPTFEANILEDPAQDAFVTRNPRAAQVSSACNQGRFLLGTTADCLQFAAGAILDLRVQNIESVQTRGVDFRGAYRWTAAYGTVKLALDGTYLLGFSQQEGPDAPPMQLLDTENNPINLKMRGTLSWQRGRFGASAAVNFQSHYRDTASDPNRNVSSYTTVDTQLRYDIDPYGGSWLANTRIELNAINLFNADPPFLNNAIAGLGYDQENADPFGRLLSVQIRKTW